MEKTRIYIGVPRQQQIYTFFADSKDQVFFKLSERGIVGGILQSRISAVDDGRNMLVDKFLQRPQGTHLLFLDSDQTFPADIGYQLLKRDKAIISGLCFTRGHSQAPQVYKYAGKKPNRLGEEVDHFESLLETVFDFLTSHKVPPSLTSGIIDGDDGLIEIDGCAAGCLLVRRDVFEKIGYPYFRLAKGIGEDFFFCLKAKEHGYKIWADLGVICGHLDIRPVGQREFQRAYIEETRAEAVQKEAVALKPNINTRPYWDQIWAMEGAGTWRRYPLTFEKIAAYIDPSESVLDVGCGVGILLDTLRPHCKEVAGLDISPVAIDALRSKGIYGKIGELPKIGFPDKSFDVITATEIVEHLDDPVTLLSEAVRVARKKVILTVPDNVLGPEELAEHRAIYTTETLEQMLRRFFDHISIESFVDSFDTPECRIALPTLLAKCEVRQGKTVKN